MKKQNIFLVCILALLLAFAGCKSNDAPAKTDSTASADGTISGADLDKIEEDNKEKENYLVIDVRGPEQYNEGHVKHAINIPLDTLESRLSEIESFKDKNVITVCNTGKRVEKLKKFFKTMALQKF